MEDEIGDDVTPGQIVHKQGPASVPQGLGPLAVRLEEEVLGIGYLDEQGGVVPVEQALIPGALQAVRLDDDLIDLSILLEVPGVEGRDAALLHPLPDPGGVDVPLDDEPIRRDAPVEVVVGEDGAVVVETDLPHQAPQPPQVDVAVAGLEGIVGPADTRDPPFLRAVVDVGQQGLADILVPVSLVHAHPGAVPKGAVVVEIGEEGGEGDGPVTLVPWVFPGHGGLLGRRVEALVEGGEDEAVRQVGELEVEHRRVHLPVPLPAPDPLLQFHDVVQDGGPQVPFDTHLLDGGFHLA